MISFIVAILEEKSVILVNFNLGGMPEKLTYAKGASWFS